jgi:hypothetical protein
VIRDHVHLGDSEAVISSAGTYGSACFVTCEFYVVAHVGLEINSAGELENLTTAVFRNCVAAIKSTQAALNADLVRVTARVGSLGKPEARQQDRYNHH